MDTLPADLQDIIFDKIDSKALYDIIKNKPSKIISQVLENRNQTILKKLIDEVFALTSTSITIDHIHPSRIRAEFTDHITILYSVIHLPNMHPLAKESIEHLMARYPTPDNSISIKNNASNIIDEFFDFKYFNGLLDNEDCWDMFLDVFIKKPGNYSYFNQQFYLLCNIIIQFYQNDYKENEKNFLHKINLRGFSIDLICCLNSLCYYGIFTEPGVVYMIDALQI